jgi:hypothetical protein
MLLMSEILAHEKRPQGALEKCGVKWGCYSMMPMPVGMSESMMLGVILGVPCWVGIIVGPWRDMI